MKMAKSTKEEVKKNEKQLGEGKIIAAEKLVKSVHVKGVMTEWDSGSSVFSISETGQRGDA